MRTSESIKNLAVAMNNAQKEMTAAKKDADNPFFKSKYADLVSVIKAIKGPMLENGLSYSQSPIMENGMIGVETMIMHVSGEWMSSRLLLPIVKQDPQAAGSAITYARRYALSAMLGLPAADDDAELAMDRVTRITSEQAKKIKDLIKEVEADEGSFLKWVQATSIERIQAASFDKCITALEGKRKKAKQQC